MNVIDISKHQSTFAAGTANEEITVDVDYNGSQWFLAVLYGLDIKFAAECNDVTTEEVEHRMDMALSATCKEM